MVFVQIRIQTLKSKWDKRKRKALSFSFYGDCASVDRADWDGAQTIHVRSALVVVNDISFGCLIKQKQYKNKSKFIYHRAWMILSVCAATFVRTSGLVRSP